MKASLSLFVAMAGALVAQEVSTEGVVHLPEPPVFKVDVVSKTTQAINYRYLSGSTKINFTGTSLMPRAGGQAKVESKRGRIEIEAEFRDVGLPTQFGAEYLTYVLWAITPEGRPSNLGEIVLNKGRGKLQVTTDLQVFGLVVTAEPYFSVTQPSDLIVLENEVRKGTKGRIHFIEAKYELLKRGQYEKLANPLDLGLDLKNVPLEVYEARNAVQIARSVGADRYASDIFPRAEAGLQMAENALKTNDKKLAAQHARQAVQSAEDARVVALRRQDQERIERQQREAAERAARAKAEAERAEAERQAEAERRTRAETERVAAERKRMEAELEAARAAAARAEAEAARAQSMMEQQEERRRREEAQRLAQEARLTAEQAEQEKQQLRQKLLQQFNMVLETRDTERGLVVNLSDVLFDVGKYDLRPIAREKLARLAGIILNYPGLKLEAEGHTDSTGSYDFNMTLSQNRAGAVRDYLISQGIDPGRIGAVGMGPDMPIASNDTAQGRQQNRRVEIIVSGEVIGTKIG